MNLELFFPAQDYCVGECFKQTSAFCADMKSGFRPNYRMKTMGGRDAKANLNPLYQPPLSQRETETLAAELITDTLVVFEKLPIWQMLMLCEI